MRVPFVDLGSQFVGLRDELTAAFVETGETGQFILGDSVVQFEQKLAEFCETEYAISVANGTDALIIALRALDIGAGDEVITAPNSFIASAGAIAAVGAKIKFVDVGVDYNLDPGLLADAITPNTKAIIPVHLTGNPADMDAINAIARKHDVAVIEDAAQAIGARYSGRRVGGLGDIACFSLHPLKNFHLMGDAGFISTNDKTLYERMMRLRNHGLANRNEAVEWGLNSRCDALQAKIGLIKAKYFSQWTERFIEIASLYKRLLQDKVMLPECRSSDVPVFHNFVVQVENRDLVMEKLAEKGVDTKIHYPIPLHLMTAAKPLGYSEGDFPATEHQSVRIMSLPIYPELSNEQVHYVAASLINVLQELNQ